MKKTLLLTGGSGMVGRNIRCHPRASEWKILAPTSQELNLLASCDVHEYIERTKPDLVVHAAGKVGGIAANIAEPVSFLDHNLIIGRNVIMASKQAGIKKLLNLASTCIYPRAAENPLSEDLLLTGALEPTNEGYALAKIVALKLCDYVRLERPDFQYKTLIPCNLFGPHDKFDAQKSHLLPAIINKVHTAYTSGQDSVEIWGDGNARREFMYAQDLAEAVFRAADDMDTLPAAMNVGVGRDHTINEYYAAVAKVIGWGGKFVHDLTKPVGMARKLCDTSKQSAWGWHSNTSLEDGIAKTYEFYLETMRK